MQTPTDHLQYHPRAGRVARLARWLPVLACAVLAACASVGSSQPPQELIKQRATARWQALVAGEFSRAYTYNTPGFRAVLTADGFRNRINSGAVIWVGAEAEKVDCPEPTKCKVLVRLDYKAVMSPLQGKLSTYLDEIWLLEEGQWWFFQKI